MPDGITPLQIAVTGTVSVVTTIITLLVWLVRYLIVHTLPKMQREYLASLTEERKYCRQDNRLTRKLMRRLMNRLEGQEQPENASRPFRQ